MFLGFKPEVYSVSSNIQVQLKMIFTVSFKTMQWYLINREIFNRTCLHQFSISFYWLKFQVKLKYKLDFKSEFEIWCQAIFLINKTIGCASLLCSCCCSSSQWHRRRIRLGRPRAHPEGSSWNRCHWILLVSYIASYKKKVIEWQKFTKAIKYELKAHQNEDISS